MGVRVCSLFLFWSAEAPGRTFQAKLYFIFSLVWYNQGYIFVPLVYIFFFFFLPRKMIIVYILVPFYFWEQKPSNNTCMFCDTGAALILLCLIVTLSCMALQTLWHFLWRSLAKLGLLMLLLCQCMQQSIKNRISVINSMFLSLCIYIAFYF